MALLACDSQVELADPVLEEAVVSEEVVVVQVEQQKRFDPLLDDVLQNITLNESAQPPLQPVSMHHSDDDEVELDQEEEENLIPSLFDPAERKQLCSTVTSLSYVFTEDAVAVVLGNYKRIPSLVFGIVTGLRTRRVRLNEQIEFRLTITDFTLPVLSHHDALVLPNGFRYVLLYMNRVKYEQIFEEMLTENDGNEENAHNLTGSVLVMSNPEVKLEPQRIDQAQLCMDCQSSSFLIIRAEKIRQFEQLFLDCMPEEVEQARQLCCGDFARFRLQLLDAVHLKYCAALWRWWHYKMSENLPTDNPATSNSAKEQHAYELFTKFQASAGAELLISEQKIIEEYRQEHAINNLPMPSVAEGKYFAREALKQLNLTYQSDALYRACVRLESIGILRMDEFLRISERDGDNQPINLGHYFNFAEKGAYIWCMYVRFMQDDEVEYSAADEAHEESSEEEENEEADFSDSDMDVEFEDTSEETDADDPMQTPRNEKLLQTAIDMSELADKCIFASEKHIDELLFPVFMLPSELDYQAFFGPLLESCLLKIPDDNAEQVDEADFDAETCEAELRNMRRFHNILSLFHFMIGEKTTFPIQFSTNSYCDIRKQLLEGDWGDFFRELHKKIRLRPSPGEELAQNDDSNSVHRLSPEYNSLEIDAPGKNPSIQIAAAEQERTPPPLSPPDDPEQQKIRPQPNASLADNFAENDDSDAVHRLSQEYQSLEIDALEKKHSIQIVAAEQERTQQPPGPDDVEQQASADDGPQAHFIQRSLADAAGGSKLRLYNLLILHQFPPSEDAIEQTMPGLEDFVDEEKVEEYRRIFYWGSRTKAEEGDGEFTARLRPDPSPSVRDEDSDDSCSDDGSENAESASLVNPPPPLT